MSQQPEKYITGFVVSVLLHAIFFAGCLALDAGSFSLDDSKQEVTEVQSLDQNIEPQKPKS